MKFCVCVGCFEKIVIFCSWVGVMGLGSGVLVGRLIFISLMIILLGFFRCSRVLLCFCSGFLMGMWVVMVWVSYLLMLVGGMVSVIFVI